MTQLSGFDAPESADESGVLSRLKARRLAEIKTNKKSAAPETFMTLLSILLMRTARSR
jgi:hypothetical protein